MGEHVNRDSTHQVDGETARKANRLAKEASPYLLQHAYNPVEWWPWSEEALAEARRRDVPILLSIGYSACHWCHVMERESFEDPAIAQLMNELFVNIKVDREERPDLDQIYQLVVQLLGRSGGWPLTVFLTPSQKPFSARRIFRRRIVTGCRASPRCSVRSRRPTESDATRSTGRRRDSPGDRAGRQKARRIAAYAPGPDLLERASRRSSAGSTRRTALRGAPSPEHDAARGLLRRGSSKATARRSMLCGFSSSRCVQVGSGISSAAAFTATDRRALARAHFEKML